VFIRVRSWVDRIVPGNSLWRVSCEESKTEFVKTPEQESRWNPSEENQQEPSVLIKLLQFLVILAASLVELIFRADLHARRQVSPGMNKVATRESRNP
jgi:hypothetical protein